MAELDYLRVSELTAASLPLMSGQLHLDGDEPRLPTYFVRDVDRVLTKRVERAANGTSTVVFAVSNGTSGKTRACWEAIQRGVQALAEWRVWPKLSPLTPNELLDGCGKLSPHTVLWLDDSERYLREPGYEISNEVAKALRELLVDQSRAPVLIMGTLHARHWRELTSRPVVGESDFYPHVRALLTGQEITVPEFFTPSETEQAKMVSDQLIADAAQHAPQRDVIQYLAAVPELRSRVETADSQSKAVLSALVEYRRIGASRSVSLQFLERVSAAYLTDGERCTLSEGWVADAIDDLRRPGAGGRSVVKLGYEKDESVVEPRYRLDDYLERQKFSVVTRTSDPNVLWGELRREVTPQALQPAAEEARRRGLLREAANLYLSSHHAGASTAMANLASMLRDAGRIDEAMQCYRISVANGDSDSIRPAWEMLVSSGRRQAALDFIQTAIGSDRREGATLTALTYAEMKDQSAAVSWFRKAAGLGDQTSLYVATEMLAESKRLPEAKGWLEELISAGNTDALVAGATAISEVEDVHSSVLWLRKLADRGDSEVLLAGAKWLFAEGVREEALTWLETAAERGGSEVLTLGAQVLVSCGLQSEALEWARQAANMDDSSSYISIGDAFRETGLLRRALECYDTAARAGELLAYSRAIETAADFGNVDEAKEWRRRAIRAKADADVDVGAICARLATNGKRPKEAAQWFFEDADASNPDCIYPLIRYLVPYPDQIEQAIDWYKAANGVDRSRALCWVSDLLAGDRDTQDFAAQLLEEAGDAGVPDAYISAARILINLHRAGQAVRVLLKAKALGDTRSSTYMAIAYASIYWFESALESLNESFERGDFTAAAAFALMVFRHYEATEYRKNPEQEGLDDTNLPKWNNARSPLAVAFDVLNRAIEAGDVDALVCKAQLLAFTNRFSQAIELYLRAIETGEVIDSRRASERSVATWLGAQLYSSEKSVTDQLDEVCDKAGRSRDFKQFLRYGMDPGATISQDWTVGLGKVEPE